MATPRELIRRAAENRTEIPAPAPVRMQETQVDPGPVAAPQPVKRNSVYRQLMQRHDRMHTRHIQG